MDAAQEIRELEVDTTDETVDELLQAKDRLRDSVLPALAAAVDEIASGDNAKDAMKFMKHDLVGKPEIKYWYDVDNAEVVITEIRSAVDSTGTVYESGRTEVRLIPDPALSPEMLKELAGRIPFTNRGTIPLT